MRVVDRGPGIPEDQREAVFQPFQRLDDAAPQGIGPDWPSRRLRGRRGRDSRPRRARPVENHRHPSRCHSQIDDGSARSGGALRGCLVVIRVLVVDDERQIRRALLLNLRARGYEIVEAATGEAAIRLAASEHPDLVLLDLKRRDRWPRRHHRIARLDAGADHRAHRARRRARESARARRRRRRLRHQTVRYGRVAGAAARRDAPLDLRGAGGNGRDVSLDARSFESAPHGDKQRSQAHIRLAPTGGPSPTTLRVIHRLVMATARRCRMGTPPTARCQPYCGCIVHIRRKLEPIPSQPRYFITEPGMGYRFVSDAP